MPETTDFDLDPIRPDAAPQLNAATVGVESQKLAQPIYVRMTEVLVRWLRFHFSVATRIEYPNLVERVWVDSPNTPIVIASLAEWKPTNADQRPVILVDRMDQDRDLPHRGIGDQYQGVRQDAYSFITVGQHVVHCFGGREGEAEYLAAEVWRELVRFAPLMRDRLCLLRLLPYKIGKRVQLSDDHKETYNIPIVIMYGYWDS